MFNVILFKVSNVKLPLKFSWDFKSKFILIFKWNFDEKKNLMIYVTYLICDFFLNLFFASFEVKFCQNKFM